jgi:hypothetical protein
MRSMFSRGSALALTAVVAVGLLVAVAQAHTVDVVGGKTKLELGKKAAAKLDVLGIEAKGTTYAVTGGAYSFHALNDGGGGTIKHKGALTLSRDGVKVKLARFIIDLPAEEHHAAAAHAGEDHGEGKLTAATVGKRGAIASFVTGKYKPLDDEPGFTGLGVVLNERGAKKLNKAFDTEAFKAGLRLGTLSNESKIHEDH